MSYWLGIDVGSTCVSAAICRAGREPEPVALGSGGAGSDAVSAEVCAGADGKLVVGAPTGDQVVRGFVGRVGDEVPMVVGGVPYSAAGVLALVVRWVVDRVAVGAGGPAAGVVVTHPVGWGAYKVGVVAQALAGVGLPGVRLCSEPVAAAMRGLGPAGVAVVYDLGGESCDVSVIRGNGSGDFSVARSAHLDFGGVDFDDAVFGRVVNAVPEWGGLDAEDPGVLAAGVVLRRECRGAKEVLSADTEVRIPVVGPGVESSVRLVRAEFEELVRAAVVETLEVLRGVLGSAGVGVAEVDAVLLVGGSSRVPLVSQVVSAGLGCPVVVDGDSQVAVAMGAALYARSLDIPSDTGLAIPESALAIPSGENDVPVGSGSAERPALRVVPLELPPAEPAPSRVTPSRARILLLAGGLAVLTAAGVGSVPYLRSLSDPVPSAAVAVPAPGTGTPAVPAAPSPGATEPAAAAGAGGTTLSDHAGYSETARTVPLAVPVRAADGAGGVRARPAPATGNPVPAGDSSPTNPKPIPGGTPPPVAPPPVATPPPAEPPPVATTPPAEPPPVATTPPAEPPPVATTPPAEPPPVATTPPAEKPPPGDGSGMTRSKGGNPPANSGVAA